MILVTGATGQIGQYLIHSFANSQECVRAFVRTPAKGHLVKHPNVEIIYGNFADKASLRMAVMGIEKVLILCSDTPDSGRFTQNMVEAAIATRVKHLVRISAQSASAQPPVGFGQLHAEADLIIQRSGIPYTILRPYFFMENFLAYSSSIALTNTFYAPLSDALVAMVSKSDVAQVAYQTLIEPGHEDKIYNISGPEPLTFYQAADYLTKGLGRPIRYIGFPLQAMKAGVIDMVESEWHNERLIELFEALQAGLQSQTTDIVKTVGKTLPQTFREFIIQHKEALQGETHKTKSH